jgi:hypothetical protein
VDRCRTRIALVGRIPPPPGGVASSIVSILCATSDNAACLTRLFDWHELDAMRRWRPHVVHFNFSRSGKRLAGSLVGRLLQAKVVHTIHSSMFDFEDRANRAALRLSHGVILVNDHMLQRFRQSSGVSHLVCLTPVLDVASIGAHSALEDDVAQRIAMLRPARIAVVYAHLRDFRDGVETYGFQFVGRLLPRLDALGFAVLFLDPKAAYHSDEINPNGASNFIHVRKSVDFRALCRAVDVYLRPTATDGNSVAVLEACAEAVPVLASDAVARPAGVSLYRFGDEDSFCSALTGVFDRRQNASNVRPPKLSTAEDYVRFIRSL